MEADLRIDQHIIIHGAELIITTSKASGPGGQHVNKTSSRVTLRWDIRESKALNEEERHRLLKFFSSRLVHDAQLVLHVETERSQFRNREIARERLRLLLKKALQKPKARVATKPSLASKTRRLGNKKRRGLIKKLRQKSL